MRARRLLSFILILALALPCLAIGETEHYTMYYTTTGWDGQPTQEQIDEGQGFTVHRDDTGSALWFEVLPDFMATEVRITVETDVGYGVQTYTFYDTLSDSEWLSIGSGEYVTAVLRSETGETLQGKQISVSNQEPPYWSGENGNGNGPENVEPPADLRSGYWRVLSGIALSSAPNGYPEATLNADDVVYFDIDAPHSYTNDDSGALWYLVTVKSQETEYTGYIPAGSSYVMSDAEVNDFLNPPPAEEPMPTLLTGYLKVPDTGAVLVYNGSDNYVEGGKVLTYLGENYADAGTGYRYVLVEVDDGSGLRGYVQLRSVVEMNAADVEAHEDSKKPEPDPMPEMETNYLKASNSGATLEESGTGNLIGVAAGEMMEYLGNSDVDEDTGARALSVRVLSSDATGMVSSREVTPVSEATLREYNEEQDALRQQQDAAEAAQAVQDILDARQSDYASVSAQTGAVLTTQTGDIQLALDAVVRYLDEQTDENTKKQGMVAVAYEDAAGNVYQGTIEAAALSFFTPEQENQYITRYLENKYPMPDISGSKYAAVSGSAGTTLYAQGTFEGTLLPGQTTVRYLDDYLLRDGGRYLLVEAELANGAKITGYVLSTEVSFYAQDPPPPAEPSPSEQPSPSAETSPSQSSPTVQPAPTNLESVYATVNKSTVLRDRTTNGQTRLTQGTVVRYQNASYDENNQRWLLVEVDDETGTTGYVLMDDVDFMSRAQQNTHISGQSGTGETIPSGGRYAWVRNNYTNVRQAPTTGADIRIQLNKDAVVLVNGATTATDGTVWYYVDYNGTVGYMRADTVQLMTQAQHNDEVAKRNPSPSASAVPSPSPVLTQYVGYVKTTQLAPMYVNPGVGYALVAAVNANSYLFTYSQQYVDGKVWCYVYYNGKVGHILQDYLVAVSTSEAINAITSPAPSTAPTANTGSMSGYGLLTGDNVNFRTSASMSSSRITQLKKNTIVRIIETVQSEGYYWYFCESNGRTGYLRSDFVTPLTVREYELVKTSSSYDQNGNIITPTATANTNGINTSTWATPNASSAITFVTIPPLTSASPSPSPDGSASPSPDSSATDADGALIGGLTPSPDPFSTLPPDGEATEAPTDETSGFSPPGLLLALVVLLILVAGGLYGYSIYNKTRRKQSEGQAKRLSEEARRKQRQEELGAKPAVRRPTPPVSPTGTGQPGKPGAPGAQNSQAKPGAPGAQSGQPRPGTPGTANGQAKPGGTAAGTPGSTQANPYARPQTQQPPKPAVQDVTSTLPRAQVDGKPVSGGGTTAKPDGGGAQTGTANGKPAPAGQPQNPYVRPASTTEPKKDAAAGAQSAPERQHMPIAPPPVTPDDGPVDPTLRRRRRRQADSADSKDET